MYTHAEAVILGASIGEDLDAQANVAFCKLSTQLIQSRGRGVLKHGDAVEDGHHIHTILSNRMDMVRRMKRSAGGRLVVVVVRELCARVTEAHEQ